MSASDLPRITLDDVRSMTHEALAELRACPASPDDLTRWESRHLGRRSPLARSRSALRALSSPQRAAVGRELGRATDELTRALADLRSRVDTAAESSTADTADPCGRPVDPTHLPESRPVGGRHPVGLLLDETVRHFAESGFSLRDSPQLEDRTHSFDLLGVAPDHPTRSAAHTFYAEGDVVLRGHTTASVLRVLAAHREELPLRFVVAGPCHRNTVPGPRFVTQFHQLEAVAVGPGVRMSDLKGMVSGFVEEILGPGFDPRLRFRSFPYVSPGLAVDVECRPCRAAGCDMCRGSGRLEVMGGGLLAPAVLRAAGCPDSVRGAALAISLERVLAVRHALGDIRQFLSNDPRLLAQFD